MSTRSREQSSLHTSLQGKVIPVVENRIQLSHALELPAHTILLRHCNLFDLEALLLQAHQRHKIILVNVDQIDGIHADVNGLDYLARHFLIQGIVSNNARVLAQGKSLGLTTIQRVFAVDSTGLGTSLETVNPNEVDLLDISPALVIPHLTRYSFPLPFIGSGLVSTPQQMQAVLQAGAQGVAVSHPDLWV